MIRQGIVQDTMSELSNPGALPHHLPQWSRINTLDKGRYPKAFLKDRLQPLPNTLGMEKLRLDTQDSEDRELDLSEKMNPQLRVQHLEKSINFLRVQHHEVLANLHDEIEKLKRENKELNFRIVMLQKNGASPPASSGKRSGKRSSAQRLRSAEHRGSASSQHRVEQQQPPTATQSAPGNATEEQEEGPVERVDEIKLIFLEEEIKEVKKALRDEKNKNLYLTQMLEKSERERQQRHVFDSPVLPSTADDSSARTYDLSLPSTEEKEFEKTEVALSAAKAREAERQEVEDHEHNSSGPLPFNAGLNPLQVHLPAQAPRPPSMKECEIIIRHLQQLNDKQSHELNQLKSDLRDVLYSHKWTPDAYLLAKAYIADDDAKEITENGGNFPKIPLRQPNRKLPDSAYSRHHDVSTLPALTHTVSNRAIERQKRVEVMNRGRVRKERLN